MEKIQITKMRDHLIDVIRAAPQSPETIADALLAQGALLPPFPVGTKRTDPWMGEEFVSCIRAQIDEGCCSGEICWEEELDRGKTIVSLRCTPWYKERKEEI